VTSLIFLLTNQLTLEKTFFFFSEVEELDLHSLSKHINLSLLYKLCEEQHLSHNSQAVYLLIPVKPLGFSLSAAPEVVPACDLDDAATILDAVDPGDA